MKRSGGLDADLGQYEYLSDVYALKGRKRLSFKYSDDDAFAFDSENYYYPTLNVKYPKTMGDFITSTSCQLEQAARTMDLSNTFDDGNLFVFDLVDPAVSADFGRVEIEMAYDGVGEMEGFEEMTEFANSDGEVTATISGFFNRYDAYDARSLGQVEFAEFNTLSDTADPARVFAIVAAISSTHFGAEQFLSVLSLSTAAEGLNAVPFGSEPAKTRALDAVAFDVKRADIADLLKLYVNYKRSDEGIVLYFNYYNYLNTPFVKVVDGKAYPDYIESSYCRVAPRETGYVSIVVQLKYYKNGDLAGYKNATVATYKVTNLSDDKPKFAIEEVSRLKKGDLKKIGESPNVTVTVRDAVIDLSAYSAELQSENPEFNLYVDIETDRRLSAPYEFGIDYPYDLAEPTGVDGAGFEVDKSVNGYFGVTVNEKSLDTVKIGMRMKKTVSELSSYINRY